MSNPDPIWPRESKSEIRENSSNNVAIRCLLPLHWGLTATLKRVSHYRCYELLRFIPTAKMIDSVRIATLCFIFKPEIYSRLRPYPLTHILASLERPTHTHRKVPIHFPPPSYLSPLGGKRRRA